MDNCSKTIRSTIYHANSTSLLVINPQATVHLEAHIPGRYQNRLRRPVWVPAQTTDDKIRVQAHI